MRGSPPQQKRGWLCGGTSQMLISAPKRVEAMTTMTARMPSGCVEAWLGLGLGLRLGLGLGLGLGLAAAWSLQAADEHL